MKGKYRLYFLILYNPLYQQGERTNVWHGNNDTRATQGPEIMHGNSFRKICNFSHVSFRRMQNNEMVAAWSRHMFSFQFAGHR
jgi:hypothetical protein